MATWESWKELSVNYLLIEVRTRAIVDKHEKYTLSGDFNRESAVDVINQLISASVVSVGSN